MIPADVASNWRRSRERVIAGPVEPYDAQDARRPHPQ